jgi:hypothetical protein
MLARQLATKKTVPARCKGRWTATSRCKLNFGSAPLKTGVFEGESARAAQRPRPRPGMMVSQGTCGADLYYPQTPAALGGPVYQPTPPPYAPHPIRPAQKHVRKRPSRPSLLTAKQGGTNSCNRRSGRGTPVDVCRGNIVALSSEYHRRQATTLTQLAQTTRNLDTAKALLRMAAERLVQADETVRITELTDRPPVDPRRDRS